MLYGFYTYGTNGKTAILLYTFDSGRVRKVKEDDRYTFDLWTDKVLFDHNTRAKFRNMPRHLNLTYGQLEDWSSNNLNDVVKIALKSIFRKNTLGKL